MVLRGGIVAPINKERLETELYIYGRQRKPAIRVHSIQVPRAVRGCRDGKVDKIEYLDLH